MRINTENFPVELHSLALFFRLDLLRCEDFSPFRPSAGHTVLKYL